MTIRMMRLNFTHFNWKTLKMYQLLNWKVGLFQRNAITHIFWLEECEYPMLRLNFRWSQQKGVSHNFLSIFCWHHDDCFTLIQLSKLLTFRILVCSLPTFKIDLVVENPISWGDQWEKKRIIRCLAHTSVVIWAIDEKIQKNHERITMCVHILVFELDT